MTRTLPVPPSTSVIDYSQLAMTLRKVLIGLSPWARTSTGGRRGRQDRPREIGGPEANSTDADPARVPRKAMSIANMLRTCLRI